MATARLRASFQTPVNHKTSSGVFAPTDLNFYPSGSADECVPNASETPVRLYKQGQSYYLEVTNRSGKGIRYQVGGTPTVKNNYIEFLFSGVTFRYYSIPTGVKLKAPVASSLGPKTYQFNVASLLGGAAALRTNAQDGGIVSDVFSLPRAFAEGANGQIYPCSAWRQQGT